MDAMEDMDLLSGSNTHLSKLSSDGNMAAAVVNQQPLTANNIPAVVSAAKINTNQNGSTLFPGIKYRNIGKTGLKCSNIGLGKF